MLSESVRRARQHEYSAVYRDNKRDRRSPARRDVAQAIAIMVMERGKASLEKYVVNCLVRASFDRRESEKVCGALFRDAVIARSDREIRKAR